MGHYLMYPMAMVVDTIFAIIPGGGGQQTPTKPYINDIFSEEHVKHVIAVIANSDI